MELRSTSTDELHNECQETCISLEDTIQTKRKLDRMHLLTNRFLLRRVRKPKKCLVQVSCHNSITDLFYSIS